MNNKERASISIMKILGVCLILLLVTGIGVKATNMKLSNVKIVLANDYEMSVMTTKTKVSEILEDNHIVLLEDEISLPSLDSEISDNKTIKIVKSDYNMEEEIVAETTETQTVEEILSNYSTITEKIVKEQVVIPFETITKDVSETVGNKKEKVIKEGENGLKEITYQVKYQNDVEIEKIELSSVVIKEPVNKIVQVQSVVTSRSTGIDRTHTTSGAGVSGVNKGTFKVTAYCPCSKCCGSSANGITASGTRATAGRTVAASSQFPLGTKLKINGNIYVVEDRGGAIQGNKIDIYMNNHSQALAWGVKYLQVEVVE